MAPEQSEDARKADIRADVYGLGCTLFYLLTGSVPYPAQTTVQKILAHREQPVPSIRQKRPEVPPELAAVVTRTLAKQPRDRYQTPAEVAAALTPFTQPPAAQPPRKRRRLLIGLAVAGLVLAGVVVYHILTDNGELVITTESDDVEVVVKQGGEFVRIIDTKTDKQITLRSGVYELELKGAPEGLKLNIGKATLTRGKVTLAKIERIEKKPPEQVGELRRLLGHRGAVTAVAFSHDGQLAASGGGLYLGRGAWPDWVDIDDYAVRLWDVKTGQELRRFVGHKCHARGLAFSPDGRLLASTGEVDQTVRVWDVAMGTELLCLRGHNSRVIGVSFLPDGNHIVTSGHDGLLRLWDLKSGKEVRTFEGPQSPVDAMAVSSDGRRALSGSQDRTVRLWDVDNGKELRRFSGHTEWIQAVAFSPDDRRALSCSIDRSIRLWDIGTAKESGRFDGHTDIVQSVAFLPDGRRALSCSFDGTVRLWEVGTGTELHCFKNHTSAVFSIAVSSDGRYALSGSNDKTVRLWRLPDPPTDKDKP
jgi:sugar lactone lactonase YvrE